MKILPWLLLMLPVCAWAHDPAVCLPKAPWTHFTYGNIDQTITTRFDTYAVWVCEIPSGYRTYVNFFTLSGSATQFLKYATGQITKADADADFQQSYVDPTAPEQALMTSLLAKYHPTAIVAFNGAKKTQQVFALNADGTTSAVSDQAVAVAASCDEKKRVVGSNNPNGTGLYSVSGQPNASSAGTLGDVYAICTVSTPLGVN